MKTLVKKSYPLLLIAVMLVFSSFLHPIKLSASLIEYDNNSNTLKMECRVFIDDFEGSINKTLDKKINIASLTKKDKSGINKYFAKYFKITVNGEKIDLKYSASEIIKEHNVFTIKFKASDVKLKKGDKFTVDNTLFFKEFDYQQRNRITIKLPPFISEENKETIINHNTFTLTL